MRQMLPSKSYGLVKSPEPKLHRLGCGCTQHQNMKRLVAFVWDSPLTLGSDVGVPRIWNIRVAIVI
jgi:hypothetical protein